MRSKFGPKGMIFAPLRVMNFLAVALFVRLPGEPAGCSLPFHARCAWASAPIWPEVRLSPLPPVIFGSPVLVNVWIAALDGYDKEMMERRAARRIKQNLKECIKHLS